MSSIISFLCISYKIWSNALLSMVCPSVRCRTQKLNIIKRWGWVESTEKETRKGGGESGMGEGVSLEKGGPKSCLNQQNHGFLSEVYLKI